MNIQPLLAFLAGRPSAPVPDGGVSGFAVVLEALGEEVGGDGQASAAPGDGAHAESDGEAGISVLPLGGGEDPGSVGPSTPWRMGKALVSDVASAPEPTPVHIDHDGVEMPGAESPRHPDMLEDLVRGTALVGSTDGTSAGLAPRGRDIGRRRTMGDPSSPVSQLFGSEPATWPTILSGDGGGAQAVPNIGVASRRGQGTTSAVGERLSGRMVPVGVPRTDPGKGSSGPPGAAVAAAPGVHSGNATRSSAPGMQGAHVPIDESVPRPTPRKHGHHTGPAGAWSRFSGWSSDGAEPESVTTGGAVVGPEMVGPGRNTSDPGPSRRTADPVRSPEGGAGTGTLGHPIRATSRREAAASRGWSGDPGARATGAREAIVLSGQDRIGPPPRQPIAPAVKGVTGAEMPPLEVARSRVHTSASLRPARPDVPSANLRRGMSNPVDRDRRPPVPTAMSQRSTGHRLVGKDLSVSLPPGVPARFKSAERQGGKDVADRMVAAPLRVSGVRPFQLQQSSAANELGVREFVEDQHGTPQSLGRAFDPAGHERGVLSEAGPDRMLARREDRASKADRSDANPRERPSDTSARQIPPRAEFVAPAMSDRDYNPTPPPARPHVGTYTGSPVPAGLASPSPPPVAPGDAGIASRAQDPGPGTRRGALMPSDAPPRRLRPGETGSANGPGTRHGTLTDAQQPVTPEARQAASRRWSGAASHPQSLSTRPEAEDVPLGPDPAAASPSLRTSDLRGKLSGSGHSGPQEQAIDGFVRAGALRTAVGPSSDPTDGTFALGNDDAMRTVDMPASQTLSRSGAVLPRQIHEHIAQVARHMVDGTVEIRLSPEELGRVRMTFQPREDGVAVLLTADRPETLDLMRRHAGELTRSLAAAGYDSVDLTFAGGGRHRAPQPDPEVTGTGLPPERSPPPVPPPPSVPADGLDLRL